MKKLIIALVLAALVAIGFGAIRGQAFGTESGECVPAPAWTEEIEHDAVTHTETVIDSPAQDAVQEVWANFAPTKPKTFVGPPSYPSDPGGKWIVHDKIPGGHEGPDGVYSKGNTHKGGDWFYRHVGHPEVPEVSHQVVVIDREAYTETIDHPAVVCEEDPTEEPTPTDDPTPTDPPVTDTPTPTIPPVIDVPTPTPPTEEPPVVNPPKAKPPKSGEPPRQLTQCVDGAWVITEGDEVLSISGSCNQDSVPTPEEAEEEGF